jgi:hypothetical protein
MVTRTLPGLGLTGGFTDGEDGWGDAMNANLLTTSAVGGSYVLGRVAAVPAAPAQGDIYVLTTDDTVAVYDNGAWAYLPPVEGWLFYDRDAGVNVQYDGTDWVELQTGGGGGGLEDAPIDGKLYGRQDGAWVEVISSGGGGGGTETGEQIMIPLNAGWNSFGNNFSPLKATKLGRIVVVEGFLSGPLGKFAVLPVGWRPTHNNQIINITAGIGSDSAVISVLADGTLELTATAGDPNGYFACNLAYTVSEADALPVGGGGGGGGVSLPVLVQRAHARGSGSATAVLPTPPTAGNALVLVCSGYSSDKTIPPGFVKVVDAAQPNNRVLMWIKLSDGTEGVNYQTQGTDWNNTSIYEFSGVGFYAGDSTMNIGGQGADTLYSFTKPRPAGGSGLMLVAFESDFASVFTVSDAIPSIEVYDHNQTANHWAQHRLLVMPGVTTISGKATVSKDTAGGALFIAG